MGNAETHGQRLDVLRTQLANERTLLAYARTTLALFIVAGSAVKFFDSHAIQAADYAGGVLGVATLAAGGWSYRRTRRIIAGTDES